MLSIVSYPERGQGGKNSYRGNCSPKMIEDIIDQFGMQNLNDYMVGSGTTEDVCRSRGVETHCYDLNRGFDLMNMDIPERPENIFWHPPYADMIVYSDVMYKAQDIIDQYGFDPRINDLSRCKDWDDFKDKMNYCMMKQFASLEKGGRMFVLVGDMKRKGKLYSMAREMCIPGTLENIVIKVQHNATSYRNSYSGKFIPIIHEYLLIVKKDNAVIVPLMMSKNYDFDIRDSMQATWRDVIASVLEQYGSMRLKGIYLRVKDNKKCKNNKNYEAKVRQTLYMYDDFVVDDQGYWRVASKRK